VVSSLSTQDAAARERAPPPLHVIRRVFKQEQYLVAAGERQECALDGRVFVYQVSHERFVRLDTLTISASAVRKRSTHDAARDDREREAQLERHIHDGFATAISMMASRPPARPDST